jgi:predicted 3-demethylubiquinone-9 3-methyltransferase (glyoxalase superfamily)
MSRTQKITPMLWFDDNAEEAVNHYVSIFKNSRIENMTRYGEAGPRPKGSVMTIGFELEGQAFTALNGGPLYKFSEALSLSTAKLRKKWTNSGTCIPMAGKRGHALG